VKKKLLLFLCAGTLSVAAEQLVQKYDFDRNCEAWYAPPYWSGKLVHSNEAKSGKGSAKLTATSKKNQISGRMVSQNLTKIAFAGKKFKITFYAKGRGKLFTGMLSATVNSRGRNDYKLMRSDNPLTLTTEWQKGETVIDLSTIAPVTLSLFFELRGEGEALIDEVRLVDLADSSTKISPVTPHTVISDKASIPPIRFSTTKPETDASIMIFSTKQKMSLHPVKSNAAGTIVWQGANIGVSLNHVTAAMNGTTCDIPVSVLPDSEYAAFDALARKVKPVGKTNILWLGDSLCDFDRSFNAVDKLSFWLNKYNPGKYCIENRAVRGDYILRVVERMLGKKCFSSAAYDNIWNNKYDFIIIQLGNNDCMTTTNNKFAAPLVATKQIVPAYEQLLKIIRKNSSAKIIVTSGTYPDVPLMVSRGERALGKYFFARFGTEQFVLPFNAAVKEFAAKNSAEFIDLYTPMKQAYNKNNYVDGIHLSETGHTLMSKILLTHFANRK
jgi:lysophospholipase L1-like esterase